LVLAEITPLAAIVAVEIAWFSGRATTDVAVVSA